jgi:hypothetical protein
MGGAKSPAVISRQLATELAEVIPESDIAILPGLGHLAPEEQPGQIASAILTHSDPIASSPTATTGPTNSTPSPESPPHAAP